MTFDRETEDGMNAMAEAIDGVAAALVKLGTASASTPFGAIELLSLEIKNGSERIAESIESLADSVRELARHDGQD